MSKWFFLFFSTVLISGCAHQNREERQCRHEACQHKAQPGSKPPGANNPQMGVQSPAEAQVGARFDIMGSPHLTLEQKNQFMRVMNETQSQVTVIKQKEGELKAELFKSLASGQYDRKAMNRFKKNLRKLEDEKMNLMFSSLDQVKVILGDKIKDSPDLFDQFHNMLL